MSRRRCSRADARRARRPGRAPAVPPPAGHSEDNSRRSWFMSGRRPDSPLSIRHLRIAAAACLAFALLSLGAPVAARAQDPQPPVILPPDTLSIDEAVRMALDRNYDVA